MICMEVMDISLDKFYARAFNRNKPIPEDVLGKVAYSVIIFFFVQLDKALDNFLWITKFDRIYYFDLKLERVEWDSEI